MTVDKNMVQGKWTEIKGEIQKAWGNLTNDELEKTKGDMTAVKGLIQQKYSDSKNDHEHRLSDIYKKFSHEKDAAFESVKDKLKN